MILRQLITDVCKDTTTVVGDNIIEDVYLMTMRKRNTEDDNSTKEFALIFTEENRSERALQYLQDNNVNVNDELRNFITSLGVAHGGKLAIGSASFIDRQTINFGATFRSDGDVPFKDRFPYSEYANINDICIRGGFKFIYNLNTEKFETFKIYFQAPGTADSNGKTFNVEDDESLTLVDTQICTHTNVDEDTDLDSISEFYSRFTTELNYAHELNEIRNGREHYLNFKLTERDNREQGGIGFLLFSRPLPNQSLFPDL